MFLKITVLVQILFLQKNKTINANNSEVKKNDLTTIYHDSDVNSGNNNNSSTLY